MALLLLTLVCVLPGGSLAQDADAQTGADEWRFEVAPYLWLTGLHGDVTVKGFESSVDMDFSDIRDELDFAGLIRGEAWKGNLGFFLDGQWIKLSSRESVGPVRVGVDLQLGIVEAGALYQVYEMPLAAEGVSDNRKLSVQLLGGARYWYLKQELSPEALPDFESSKDWVDPIIGARLIADVTERASLSLRADVGGFGIGSEIASNWIALLRYRLTERWTLGGGFRLMHLDYGSGSDSFKADLTFYGPIFGAAFHF